MLTISTGFLPKMSETVPMIGEARNWRKEKRDPSNPGQTMHTHVKPFY